jgi:hypothetical protein
VADPNAEELPSYHRNVDNDESVFVHHDEAGVRKPGMLVHTLQGILRGADEAARAPFQKRRVPGMRRTICGVSVDTDRPLLPSPVYERLFDVGDFTAVCPRRGTLSADSQMSPLFFPNHGSLIVRIARGHP